MVTYQEHGRHSTKSRLVRTRVRVVEHRSLELWVLVLARLEHISVLRHRADDERAGRESVLCQITKATNRAAESVSGVEHRQSSVVDVVVFTESRDRMVAQPTLPVAPVTRMIGVLDD